MKKQLIIALVALAALFSAACGGSLMQRFGIRVEDGQLKFDEHINFATDSDEILEDSYPLLDALAQALNDHGEIHTVRVEGHTDSSGDDAHNQDLSERRAASVAAYLRAAGVEQSLTPSGFGETRPLCEEDTDECHARNRRVELVIVD